MEIEHPSFGVITINRQRCSEINLVGSAVKHSNYIEIAISKSVCDTRDLYNQKFRPIAKGNIIKIYLTCEQWAELLISTNYGLGVPCTIHQLMNQYIEEPKQMSNYIETSVRDFKDRLEERKIRTKKDIDEARKIISTLRISQKDRKKLQNLLNLINLNYSENAVYALQEFYKEMDRAMAHAKIESALNGNIKKGRRRS